MKRSLFFYMYLQFVSKIIQHFLTQHSDDLGDRKWLQTDFGVVWYTSIQCYLTEHTRQKMSEIVCNTLHQLVSAIIDTNQDSVALDLCLVGPFIQLVYLTSQRVNSCPSKVSDCSVSSETVIYEAYVLMEEIGWCFSALL